MIKRRLGILISMIISVALFSYALLVKGFLVFAVDVKYVFGLLFLVIALLICLLALEYRRYNAAKLIIENKIFDIQAVIIDGNPADAIEFIISCFGILLGSKVIRFNSGGITLKQIEIAHDIICIVYGRGNRNQRIRLLHGSMGENKIKEIAERFRYETGIAPIIMELVST